VFLSILIRAEHWRLSLTRFDIGADFLAGSALEKVFGRHGRIPGADIMTRCRLLLAWQHSKGMVRITLCDGLLSSFLILSSSAELIFESGTLVLADITGSVESPIIKIDSVLLQVFLVWQDIITIILSPRPFFRQAEPCF